MKVVIDMNLSPSWAGFLRAAGFDAVHWSDIGPVDAFDSIILGYARRTASIILTNDLDFGAILAATNGKAPSVVQIRAGDLSVKAIGSQTIAAFNQAQAALAEGALMTIDPNRFRLTLLPLAGKFL